MKKLAHDIYVSEILSDPEVPSRRRRGANHILHHLKQQGITKGKVLEIGAFKRPCMSPFPPEKFEFNILELGDRTRHDIPILKGDITNCPQLADNSYDVVMSHDVFEHIDKPWLAASEIQRILKPGGMSYTQTLFSWKLHKVPVDYWRFTPDCLDMLFSDLERVESGFDIMERRNMKPARTIPEDDYGKGWLESWRVFHVGIKK